MDDESVQITRPDMDRFLANPVWTAIEIYIDERENMLKLDLTDPEYTADISEVRLLQGEGRGVNSVKCFVQGLKEQVYKEKR